MIFNTENFAKRYALRYTMVLAVLLIVPLLFYVYLVLQIDEAKVKISLETQAKQIIEVMQRYDNDDGVFHFPRYKHYQAALYDSHYKVIFSTLAFEPDIFTDGIHTKGHYYYLIYGLPDGYYFGSRYLIVATHHTANKIYYFAAIVLSAIVVTLFVFSLLLLRSFSRPFEKLNAQLDTFIKDSMHEINTPLSIINLNADLFAQKYEPSIYLDRIKAATKTLSTIYNDMDYLVKQGRLTYRRERINISAFVQQRVDYFQEVAHLKGIVLHTHIEPDVMYDFAKTKLQRIVDNTISNAIKYSDNDNRVDITLYQKDDRVVLAIQDYGIGIENVDKIFSRYYRENDAKGGFGIGLNIVKQIIDEEGVQLQVKSVRGEGAVFRYTFYR